MSEKGGGDLTAKGVRLTSCSETSELRAIIGSILLAAVVAIVVACSASPDHPEPLLVFAAASLADAMEEIEEAFEAQDGPRLAVSYGGSQMLAQQIASGAPADIFISAGEAPASFLDERALSEPTRAVLLTNTLVVAVRDDGPSIASVQGLGSPSVANIAVADPDLAPAGRYARSSLTSLGLWAGLEPKMVFGPDVRATLAYVESGNADAALVYATDAKVGRNIRVLDIVPPDSYEPIVYPALIVRASELKPEAMKLLEFLRGSQADEIFREYGFEPAE